MGFVLLPTATQTMLPRRRPLTCFSRYDSSSSMRVPTSYPTLSSLHGKTTTSLDSPCLFGAYHTAASHANGCDPIHGRDLISLSITTPRLQLCAPLLKLCYACRPVHVVRDQLAEEVRIRAEADRGDLCARLWDGAVHDVERVLVGAPREHHVGSGSGARCCSGASSRARWGADQGLFAVEIIKIWRLLSFELSFQIAVMSADHCKLMRMQYRYVCATQYGNYTVLLSYCATAHCGSCTRRFAQFTLPPHNPQRKA